MLTTETSLDRCFKIPEAAAHLRVSRATIYKLVNERKLRLVKIGTRSIIRGSELTRFLDAAQNAAA